MTVSLPVLLAVALVLFAAGVIVGTLLFKAPEGYEDETGFHYGRHPDDPRDRHE